MHTNLSPTATSYITAIVNGEEPPVKGAIATSILRRLTKEGYVTTKGKPTKKAKLLVTHLLEPSEALLNIDGTINSEVVKANPRIAAKTKKPPAFSFPQGAIPVREDDALIGWLIEEKSGVVTIYNCFLLVGGKPKEEGFTMSKEAAFTRVRKAFRQLK